MAKRSRYLRAAMQIGGYLLAIGLLATSLWYAIQGQGAADWRILLGTESWLTAGLFVTVAVSAIVVPGLQFWLVTRPFASKRSLSFTSVQALAAAGGLLNYSPFKAGLIGRVAYLKYFHGVGYRAAALTHGVIVVVLFLSSVLTVLVTVWRGGFDLVWWATSLIGLGILAGVTAPILRYVIPSEIIVDSRLRSSTGVFSAFLVPLFAAQLLGLFVTAMRWWLVFSILGRPITLAGAWMAAIIHMVAIMVGPANGIGLREWLIGIGGQQGALSSSLGMDLQASISAALVDRAVEAVVLIVFGLLALAFLRQVYRRVANSPSDVEQHRMFRGK